MPAASNCGGGYVTISHPATDLHGRYCYAPDQTRLIAAAAMQSIADHDRMGLCIGGPRHGEMVPFGPYMRAVQIPLPGTPVVLAHKGIPSEWPPIDYDEYVATGAVTFYGGKACQILEHTDLPKQNISRQAEELDAALAKADRDYKAKGAASDEANEQAKQAASAWAKADRERTAFRWKHGV